MFDNTFVRLRRLQDENNLMVKKLREEKEKNILMMKMMKELKDKSRLNMIWTSLVFYGTGYVVAKLS